MASDAVDQAEEKETLLAIYGSDCEFEHNTCRVYLPSRDSPAHVTVLRALLPADYPSTSGPMLELEAAHVAPEQLAAAVSNMEQMFMPGEVCLFNCIEWLREQLQQWQDEAAAAALAADLQDDLALHHDGHDGSQASSAAEHDDGGGGTYSDDDDELSTELQHLPESQGRQGDRQVSAGDADASVLQQMRPLIVSGQPVTERKSTFQAHVAPVTDVEQVKAVVAILLESNKIRNATHNIMAYRISAQGRSTGIYYQDFDDDGEAAAGSRLLHLLQVADVTGVVVVVSRWFGGILLGPARFGLINNTARQLLEQTGFLKQSGGVGGSKSGSGRKLHKKKH